MSRPCINAGGKRREVPLHPVGRAAPRRTAMGEAELPGAAGGNGKTDYRLDRRVALYEKLNLHFCE